MVGIQKASYVQGLVIVSEKTEGKVIEVTAEGYELRDYRKNELRQFCYILVDACRRRDLKAASSEEEKIMRLRKRFPQAEFIHKNCCS